jgi:hypothetical protein
MRTGLKDGEIGGPFTYLTSELATKDVTHIPWVEAERSNVVDLSTLEKGLRKRPKSPFSSGRGSESRAGMYGSSVPVFSLRDACRVQLSRSWGGSSELPDRSAQAWRPGVSSGIRQGNHIRCGSPIFHSPPHAARSLRRATADQNQKKNQIEKDKRHATITSIYTCKTTRLF